MNQIRKIEEDNNNTQHSMFRTNSSKSNLGVRNSSINNSEIKNSNLTIITQQLIFTSLNRKWTTRHCKLYSPSFWIIFQTSNSKCSDQDSIFTTQYFELWMFSVDSKMLGLDILRCFVVLSLEIRAWELRLLCVCFLFMYNCWVLNFNK